MIRAALPTRVSTVDQEAIPDQLDRLQGYATARGWTVALELAEQIAAIPVAATHTEAGRVDSPIGPRGTRCTAYRSDAGGVYPPTR